MSEEAEFHIDDAPVYSLDQYYVEEVEDVDDLFDILLKQM
jgi:hypothetical protein